MGKTTTITVRVPVEYLERIKQVSDNRNAFVVEAIEEKLNPHKIESDLTEKEKRECIKGAKNLNDVMQDLILREAARRENFLSTMDNETFAKLVAARLPKELQDEGELDADVLSLDGCLKMLPGIEDLTKELNKVKGALWKAEHERDLNKKLLEHSKGKVELGELMEEVYRAAVGYAVNIVIRKGYPGFGDGGGITESGYSDIAEEVKKVLNGMEIYRRKKC